MTSDVARAQEPDSAVPTSPARDVARSRSVEASLSAGETYDGNVVPFSATFAQADGIRTSAAYSELRGNLSYMKKTGGSSLSVDLGSGLTYYPQWTTNLIDHSAAVDMSSWLGRRTLAEFGSELSSSPLSLFSAVPGLSAPAAQHDIESKAEYTSVNYMTFRQGAYSRVTERLGRHSWLSAGYEFQFRATRSEFELTTHRAAVTYFTQIRPHSVFHAGYGSRWAEFGHVGVVNSPRTHELDVGFDYSRPLPFARQTTLAFGTGSLILNDGFQQHYWFSGFLMMAHPIGRTWSARVEYRRPLQFVEGVTVPLRTDSIAAGVTGTLRRRFDVSTSAGYSSGEAGFGIGTRFEGYSGSARVKVRLSTQWDFIADYEYFRYAFGRAVPILQAIPRDLDRQSLHMGMTRRFALLR